jgi:outer membrane protein TolC
MRIATFVGAAAILCGALEVARAQSADLQPRQSREPMTSHALSMANEAPSLTLDEAVRQALGRNPDLEAARKHIDPLRSGPAQARLLNPPMLEAQVWQWPINTLNPLNTDMYMFMASQDLPGRGKRPAAEAFAEAEIRVAERRVDARAREVTTAVSAAYWDLLIARRAIEIHLASVELLHQLTDVAEAKYAAGLASQQDVLKATVETTKLHNDLVEFEQDAEAARLRLNALMNMPLDSPVGPLSGLDEATLTVSVAQLQARALDREPDLGVARAEVDRARAQQAVAKTAATPDWSVGGGYMLQPHQTDAWLARVSVTWPRAPWSRRAIDVRAAEAAAVLSSAEADAAALETRSRLDVADAFTRVKAAEERAALLRTALLPQSRQVLEGSRIAFQSDRGSVLAVIENERVLLDAQLAYERALASWRQAIVDLERALGGPVASDMVRRVSSAEVR